MPKRLIRYTLSKLDYFETDALDLDKIDVAWGQSSHLTWQDVGLKIDASYTRHFSLTRSHASIWRELTRIFAHRNSINYYNCPLRSRYYKRKS